MPRPSTRPPSSPCWTCSEWCGRGFGCEECSEFAQESGWNDANEAEIDRLRAEVERLTRQQELSDEDADILAERLVADAERLADALDWCLNSFDTILARKPHRSVAEMRAYVTDALRQHEERVG